MAKTALLLVDFQNDYFGSFDGARFPLHGTEAAAANAAGLVRAFRDADRPVVHVRHEADPDTGVFFLPGTAGAAIHDALAPQRDERVVLKHRVNSFLDTELKALLDEDGIDSLVIVGAMSHMCVDAATRAARDLGYACTVVHDACATRALEFNGVNVPAPQVHAAFMAALAFAYAEVVDTDCVLERLRQGDIVG
ncbi:cysteine hydrolase family protein [Marinobacterium aestuariivivens]|uniref:Cysteine hydrolase family protein n=1 Tax=Marinobacterium aestuariivivens TaxID=1698799 RepID=A0ABW2A3S9_9GAMM